MECGVCLEDFTKYTPRLLDCGHTFCEVCLAALCKQDKLIVECPTCRHTHKVKGTGHQYVSTLKRNYALEDVLAGRMATLAITPTGATGTPTGDCVEEGEAGAPLSTITGSEGKGVLSRSCEECEKDQAGWICAECHGMKYCDMCYAKVHSALPASLLRKRPHKPIKLELFSRPINKANLSSMCHDHPNHVLDQFCESEGVLICSQCIQLSGHSNNNHTHVPLKGAAQRTRYLLGERLTSLRQNSVKLQQHRKEYNMANAALQITAKTTEQDLSCLFQQLRDAVDACEKRTRHQLETTQDLCRQQLRNFDSVITGAERAVKNNTSEVGALLSTQNTDVELLSVLRTRVGTLLDEAESCVTAAVEQLSAQAIPTEQVSIKLYHSCAQVCDTLASWSVMTQRQHTQQQDAKQAAAGSGGGKRKPESKYDDADECGLGDLFGDDAGGIPPAPPLNMPQLNPPPAAAAAAQDEEQYDMGFSLFD